MGLLDCSLVLICFLSVFSWVSGLGFRIWFIFDVIEVIVFFLGFCGFSF